MIRTLKQRLTNYQPITFAAGDAKASVLVAVTDHPQEPKIILTQRSAGLSTHSGEVAFPGGKYDQTDHSLAVTALREAEEEVGLLPEHVELVGQLGQVMSKHKLQVTPFVGVVPYQVALAPNPGELDAVFQVPVSFLLQPENYQLQRIEAYGRVHNVPAWQYRQYTIWGLTAYILAEFINVAFDAGIPLKQRPEHRLSNTGV